MKFYEDKTVWVIGGTSGIGLAFAENISKMKNCNVIISGRDTSKVNDISTFEKVTLDVLNAENFSSTTDFLLQKYTKIDVILFCAGAYEPMNIDNFNSKIATNILNTNLSSMVNFVENIPKFYGKCSTIGIVGSVAGYFGMPNSLFYGASKAGLVNLTESLSIELAKHKINVKLISPGFVKTTLTNKNNFKMPFLISAEKAAEIIVKKLPCNKFEIAFPFLFAMIMKFLQKMPFKFRAIIFNSSKFN